VSGVYGVIDHFLLAVATWLSGGFLVAALGSFLWGLVSVLFSPCHLASIPLIVGYVAGQGRLVEGRQAAGYAALFTIGLFMTIALIGVACTLLGRMLGDVGPYWTIPVGALLLWVAFGMLGVAACTRSSGGLMARLRVRGHGGAFVLGLAYGVLSGSCTFGFIAPLLAVVTVQQRVAEGIVLVVLFGLGHCLPIVAAGSSAALVQRLLAARAVQRGSVWFRRLAGIAVGLLGGYFIIRPFLDA